MKRRLNNEELQSIYIWVGQSYWEMLKQDIRSRQFSDIFVDTFMTATMLFFVAVFGSIAEIDIPDLPTYSEEALYPKGLIRFDSEGGFTVESN